MEYGKLINLGPLDSLRFYDKKAQFETRLSDFMYSLYSRHWKFMKTLSCKERGILKDYKNGAVYLYNPILYSNVTIQHLRDALPYYMERETVIIADLNKFIRKLIITTLEEVSLLDRIFLKAPLLEKRLVVYRGLRGSIAKQIIGTKKGEEIVLKGFNSTAVDFNVSLIFGSFEGNEQDRIVLRILLHKNTRHILLPGGASGQDYGEITFKKMMETVSANDDQTELVLNRGSRLIVLGHEKHLISPRERLIRGEKYKTKKFIHITNARLLPEDEDKMLGTLPTVDEVMRSLQHIQIPVTSPVPMEV